MNIHWHCGVEVAARDELTYTLATPNISSPHDCGLARSDRGTSSCSMLQNQQSTSDDPHATDTKTTLMQALENEFKVDI